MLDYRSNILILLLLQNIRETEVPSSRACSNIPERDFLYVRHQMTLLGVTFIVLVSCVPQYNDQSRFSKDKV